MLGLYEDWGGEDTTETKCEDSQDSSSLHNKVPSEAASVDAEAEASYPKDMVKKTDFNVGETPLHQGTSRILWKNGIKR